MTDKCDSCGREADVLIPIRVLCESKGGYEMQLRHYCPVCFTDIVDEWDYPSRDGEDEENTCACCGVEIPYGLILCEDCEARDEEMRIEEEELRKQFLWKEF